VHNEMAGWPKQIFQAVCILSIFTYQQNSFPCHPPYRQHCSALYPVVVCCIQASAHAKVRDLDVEIVSNEAVAGCKVTVDCVQ